MPVNGKWDLIRRLKNESDSFILQSLIQPTPEIVVYRLKVEANIAKMATGSTLCFCQKLFPAGVVDTWYSTRIGRLS
jgi:hypothetical protein